MNEYDESPGHSRSARSARFFNYLHRYRNLLLKRWWVLPITIALGLGLQAFRLWKAPPSFVSFGKMILNIKITSATGTGTGTGFSEEGTTLLNTQAALMQSAKVRERAVDRVRALKPKLKDKESAGEVKLGISISPRTSIFNLQAIGPDPEYTQAYLDACMEEYITLKAEMRASTSETTLARIMEQLNQLDRKLREYEDEDIAFKTNNNVVFIREQVTSIATYLVQKNRLLDRYRNEYQLLSMLSLEQNLERQQKRDTEPDDKDLTTTPASLLTSDYLRAKQELQLKKVELKEWSEILRPKHPRMIALTEDITRRENLLTIFKEQSNEQLQSQRASLGLQITNLESEIKDLDVRSLDLSTKLSQYDRIVANKQNIQNLRDNLQRAMQSLGVEKDINPDTVTPLERASAAVPATGSKVKSLIIAAVLGLVCGLVFLFALDKLDDRPTSFTDLQDMFDEPVMGQIPLENAKSSEGVKLLKDGDDRHAFLEAYRNLRSSLLYMATQGKRPKILVVTSAIPGDGKSVTTANLAITMALSGSRVLLIDADMRKGLLHRRLGLEAMPGLNEVLTGQAAPEKAIVSTSINNLFLLPRGNPARNPGEMFLKPSTHDLIKSLASQYDYVIFDTAPVMAADDVTSLAPHVEGVLFVIRANSTSGRVARAALDLLYQREVAVLGLVFNGIQTNAGEYYYYRYKDYYADYKSA